MKTDTTHPHAAAIATIRNALEQLGPMAQQIFWPYYDEQGPPGYIADSFTALSQVESALKEMLDRELY